MWTLTHSRHSTLGHGAERLQGSLQNLMTVGHDQKGDCDAVLGRRDATSLAQRGVFVPKLFPNSQKYTFASFSSAPQKYFPFSSCFKVKELEPSTNL